MTAAEASRRRLAIDARLALASGAERSDLLKQRAKLDKEVPFVDGARIEAATGGGKKKAPTQAKRLIDLANKRYDVVEDQHGQAFAVPKKPPRVAVVLRGKGQSLTNRLRQDYFEKYQTLPSATNVAGVADVLEAQASGGDRVPIHIRCVQTKDALVIDLGDSEGRAVVVKEGRWRVTATPPPGVVFRRTRLTGAMPVPVRGGSLDELRDLISVTDEGWGLVVAWLVLAWLSNIPIPIPCITGRQGAGKSWLGRTLVSTVDPSSAPLRSMPSNLGEFQTAAAASRVVGLDNISRISEDMSDAFCRAATGEGAAKRQLYTDDDLIVQAYRRALLLTAIDPGALRGDLGERLMPIELEKPKKRRGEKELDALLEKRRPTILGALLDLVAEVLANPVKLTRPPRMADAGNVMAAIDRVTGSNCLATYEQALGNVAETVLEADPLAMAVLDLMDGLDRWTGTPTDLYAELMVHWDPEARNRPSSPRGMSERLERLAPALFDVHRIGFEKRRGDRREIELRRVKPKRTIRRRRPGEGA